MATLLAPDTANGSHFVPVAGAARERNVVMDLLRICFACLVLLGHSYINRDPAISKSELLQYKLGLSFQAGTIAVDGFFLLSGFLIVRSWLLRPQLGTFLQKRALRIVPGYAVAVALSLVYAGLLFPAAPGFFHGLNAHTFLSIATLSAPLTPAVFPAVPFAGVNGSLWTITYEARCYLLVAVLGTLGLLRYRFAWLALTFACLLATSNLMWQGAHHWTGHYLVTGDPQHIYTLLWPFLLGGCYALFRVPMRRWLAVAAAAGLVLTAYLPVFRQPSLFLAEAGPVFFGGYLIFMLADSNPRFLRGKRHLPDVSYGTYLYGWPIECTYLSLISRQPLLVFALSVPTALLAGWLSWHLVERPALRWRQGGTAPLPPA